VTSLASLIKKYSIQVVPLGEEFLLSSGQKSRVYCDLKRTVLRAEAREPLVQEVTRLASDFQPTVYAGVALGGCHLASVLATETRTSTVYVRKEAKGHGTQRFVEAPDLPDDHRIVLLEDVTTTANSARFACGVLRDAGYNVTGVIAIVDRRQSWPSPFIDDIPFRALYRIEELYKAD
jgi:orotate phosphoribosyltransferase